MNLAALVFLLVALSGPSLDRAAVPYVAALIQVNVLLALFNLIPLPPLDGFGFVFGLSPRPMKLALLPLHQYGIFILLAVLFLPPLREYVDQYLRVGQAVVYSYLGALAGAL